MNSELSISQSLIKEVLKHDHCPRQIMYSFIEGKEMHEPSEAMTMGRYFESQLLGSCRGGDIEQAKYYSKSGNGYKAGDKMKPFADCDQLVGFSKGVMLKLGIEIEIGLSQVQISNSGISGNIDHINNDIKDPTRKAIYDVKWTATKEDDRWNGWGDIENKQDAHIQAVHYVLTYFKTHGQYPPFYFLIFGKDKWAKIVSVKITPERLAQHEELIAHTARVIKDYAENGFKGNGSFNKCVTCAFYNECEDKATIAEIETITI